MTNVPGFIQPLYKYPVGQSPFWSITKAGGPGNSADEGGIDIPNPAHTPVYALGGGALESSHLFWHNPPDVSVPSGGAPGHGVVCIRTMIPGFGLNDLYYQHIDINPALPNCMGGNCANVGITKGQLLGWTRGDVGEIEVGVNPTGWGPVWGAEPHPGPQVDPESRIRALVDADSNFQWGGAGSNSGFFQSNGTPGSNGIVPTIAKVADQLSPDASVADWLVNLDVMLELQNPFDIQNPQQDTIGVGPLSMSINDPVAWAQDVGTNMVQDLSALAIRTMFIVVGLIIIIAIGYQMQSKASDEALAPVGGKAGAAKMIMGFL